MPSTHLPQSPLKPRSHPEAPFDFTVEITPHSSALQFRVTLSDAASGRTSTREYELAARDHSHYLDLFGTLAADFGTRVPLNRRRHTHLSGQVQCTPLVVENLSPDILYGYGDPAVLRFEDRSKGSPEIWYYVYSTSNDAPNSFPIIRSRDLKAWEPAGFIFPEGTQPAWASVGENVADYWAPEVHRVGEEFRACFVARSRETSQLCIGVAIASHPEGPFLPASAPLLQGDRIDPHLFVAEENRTYLYWKEDRNASWPTRLNEILYLHPTFIRHLFSDREDRITAAFAATLWPWTRELEPMERFFVQQTLIEAAASDFTAFEQRIAEQAMNELHPDLRQQFADLLKDLKTPIFVQPLSPDGLTLTGEPTQVLTNDQNWEAHVIEGSWVTCYSGRYYMFYAANDFSTADYGIGVAISDELVGPFRKSSEALLKSSPEWIAPGHPSVCVEPNGKVIMFLHAYYPSAVGYKQFRALLAVGLALGEYVSIIPGDVGSLPY